MGYFVGKEGKTNWRLTFERGKGENRIRRGVNKRSEEAAKLGFRPEMTYAEAKGREQQLKAQEWVELEAEKAARSKSVLEKCAKLRSAFLTEADVEEFERIYVPSKRISPSHFRSLQKVAYDVGIHPSQWYKQAYLLYKLFAKYKWSKNYVKKMLRYLNIWGYFICEKQQRAWRDVEFPAGADLTAINKANRVKVGRSSSASLPLTPQMLKDKKGEFTEPEYNWLLVSVWFGLRPREIENLKAVNRELWYIDRDADHGYVLCVFQEKLYERAVDLAKCWKYIPTVFEEQKEVIKIIFTHDLEKPVGAGDKKMRDVFGPGFTRYAGRKNFAPMLKDAGYDPDVRKEWMGHLSIETTEQSYETRGGVFYRPPVKKADAK